MGFPRRTPFLILFCWVLVSLFSGTARGENSGVYVKFLKTPSLYSNLNLATFAFEVLLEGSNGGFCADCIANCTLDHNIIANCNDRKASYPGLQDGNHTLEVRVNGSQGVGFATYNWIIDTVPPTAYVTAATSFTNALNVPVNISFSEPCLGGGGFRCSSTNSCNLIVYGPGQVLPSTMRILEPDLKFSLMIRLSSSLEYGRVILITEESFCTDRASNKFSRTQNSSFLLHFDRRRVSVSLRTHVPEKLLQLNSETRTVVATNSYKNLKAYLYFSEPILNSSADVLKSLHTNHGSLVPINGSTLGKRRFGFMMKNISSMSIITVELNSSFILSRQGTPVSPVAPVTFLYDTQRLTVSLSTKSSSRTRDNSISVWVKFAKPVFGFNSSHVSIRSGHLLSFQEVSRNIYSVETKPDKSTISISIPENVTQDVAGNRNTASNTLQVRHYSVPVASLVLSTFVSATFAVTVLFATLLTLSNASLQSVAAFSRPSSLLTSDPARNLFRIACHIQVIALSRWLAVSLPVEYFEFARGLRWSIPYFSLPWEMGPTWPTMFGSTPAANPHPYGSKLRTDSWVYGSPLSPMEYMSFFEVPTTKPEAEYLLDSHNSGWRDFGRFMFWVAVISTVLIFLHGLILFGLRSNKKNSEKQGSYGALIFPRFELFLLILVLPCISAAFTSLIRGGSTSGIVVGTLMLGFVSFLLLALFIFLSTGITFGKLLQYKEIHQEGQEIHWYRDVVHRSLGPGKRGQWTWKNQPNSVNLTMFGPLYEDLRGPPKYMLSQISLGNPPKQGDTIIASEDETEDAEAPFIQKLFGILRIYYTLIETIKRVSLGIAAGLFSENHSYRSPSIVLLSITSFQLFFLVLKKPFIKRKVQLAEIISVSSEVGIFATCFAVSDHGFSEEDETRIGIFMLSLFVFAFLAQTINEWYALYKQTKQFDPRSESFCTGLKISGIGMLILLLPRKWTGNLESTLLPNQRFDEPRDTTSSGDRQRSSGSRKSSGSTDNPWLKQLGKMAKASFSKDAASSSNPLDPSPTRTRWSGLWGTKRSGGSSQKSSADHRSRTSRLYKDLENIFASK